MSVVPLHPVTLVHGMAGGPAPEGTGARFLTDTPALCAMTGEHVAKSAPIEKALGTNFLPEAFRYRSDRVGEAAVWACSGRGKTTLRAWTIIAAEYVDLPPSNPDSFIGDPTCLCLVRTGPEREHVADILCAPPPTSWLVSVAVSAQKHVLPYTPVNSAGSYPWTVRMENTNVTSTPEEFSHVRAHAIELRRLGVPADAVMAGEPRYVKTPDALASWREHSNALAPFTGSPVLGLALWTITKGTIEK